MPRRPERRLLLGAAAAPPSFLVLLVCRRALVLLLFGLGEVGARLVVVRGIAIADDENPADAAAVVRNDAIAYYAPPPRPRMRR